MNISIVVPSYNESESLPELCSWIDKVMQANNFTYEVMIVDDGSSDDSWDVIQKIREKNSSVSKYLELRSKFSTFGKYLCRSRLVLVVLLASKYRIYFLCFLSIKSSVKIIRNEFWASNSIEGILALGLSSRSSTKG